MEHIYNNDHMHQIREDQMEEGYEAMNNNMMGMGRE
jgi:hypothetical protein